ncbi:archease family protein [Babesia caballi]|uniref:Archease family protein n=1 Tax=Babesia caballi TaxID=5871 RepID=A0AAV4LP43_BABCB|nr:archease family protein [Babesia caballi]
MEPQHRYVINGVQITSKPPRDRRRPTSRGGHTQTPFQDLPSSPPEPQDSYIAADVHELEREKHVFGYLDHPADVIITGSGRGFCVALESVVLAMFGYMTDTALVAARSRRVITVTGNSMTHLLFSVLVECLYVHSSGSFVAKHVRVSGDVDVKRLLEARGCVEVTVELYGERFDREVHTSGTEVKAVTYHGLKIEMTVGSRAVVFSENPAEAVSPDNLALLLDSCDASSLSDAYFKVYALVDI